MHHHDERHFRPHQVGLVEFKVHGKLTDQLEDAVQPLQEDGAALRLVRAGTVAAPVGEFMAKVQPLPLNQSLKALQTKFRQEKWTFALLARNQVTTTTPQQATVFSHSPLWSGNASPA